MCPHTSSCLGWRGVHECKGTRRAGRQGTCSVPSPCCCVYSLWKGREGNSLTAALAPYLGPLMALHISLLASTFSGRSQGMCRGGDPGLERRCWLCGACLAATQGWRNLLGLLSFLYVPSCRGKPCWSELTAWYLGCLQASEPVHESGGLAKALLEASMLDPSSCTPKI